MKKTLFVFMAVLLCSYSLFSFAGGNGTPGNPYQITTSLHLDDVRNHLTSSFVLMNDLDLTTDCAEGGVFYNGGQGWIPIGVYAHDDDYNPIYDYAFKGNFNGNQHKIMGLLIQITAKNGPKIGYNYCYSLFGYLNGATISDLKVEGNVLTNVSDCALLAGRIENGSLIQRCYTGGSVTGDASVGGLVGVCTESNISQSFSETNVSGSYCCGGLVGYLSADSAITDCYTSSQVYYTGDCYYLGGLVGCTNGTITNCFVVGSVSGANSGGFLGSYIEGTISNCFWATDCAGQPLGYGQQNSAFTGLTGKTSDELKLVATFTDLDSPGLTAAWDFIGNPNDDVANNSIWGIDGNHNYNYPCLIAFYAEDFSLPVTLSAFNAVVINTSEVNLKWITQSESGLLGYNVYRALDGSLSNSERLTNTLIQAENSSNEHTYNFLDKNTETNTEYTYWLESLEMNGISQTFGPIVVKTGQTAPPASDIIPLKTLLKTAYPNPFNPSTTISYEVSTPAYVVLEIFNVKGEKIRTLKSAEHQPGLYHTVWNGKDASNRNCGTGVYFCKLQAGSYTKTNKLMMLK